MRLIQVRSRGGGSHTIGRFRFSLVVVIALVYTFYYALTSVVYQQNRGVAHNVVANLRKKNLSDQYANEDKTGLQSTSNIHPSVEVAVKSVKVSEVETAKDIGKLKKGRVEQDDRISGQAERSYFILNETETWNDRCNNVSLLSDDQTYKELAKKGLKVIYQATNIQSSIENAVLHFKFDGCKHSNCVLQSCNAFDHIERADLVHFWYQRTLRLPLLDPSDRMKQTWLLINRESPARRFNLIDRMLDQFMNGTATFRAESDVNFHHGTFIKRSKPYKFNDTLVRSKTKGAFIYISNCNSVNYDRLGVVRHLSNHIDVAVQGGCGDKPPCDKEDSVCEYNVHSHYHFYLSFENSLCTEYITEKFYNALKSPLMTVPVVVGGVSVQEYTDNAPPNSFIHLYNFTSVEALGKYLHYLTENPEAYSRYHDWRKDYQVISIWASSLSCRLCEIANMNGTFVGKQQGKISQWWNDSKTCRNLSSTLPPLQTGSG